jgi:hypothetical protein
MKTSLKIVLALLISLLTISEIPFLSSSTSPSPVYAQTTGAGISLTVTASKSEVVPGTAVSYLYNATNTGEVALTGNITDATFGAVGSFVNLQPGGWVGFNVTHVITMTTSNVATAYGFDGAGQLVMDSDSAFVQVRIPYAGISLTKTPSATDVVSGSAVSFLYNATNTGETALTGAIYDDVFGSVGSFVNLQPGGWVAYNVTHVLTQSVFNTATVYGVDVFGHNVTDSASAFVEVRVPSISVEKTGSPEEQLAPGTITWNVTVTNTGAVPLNAVNITDTRHGYLGSIETLNPDQTIFFVIVETGLPPGTYNDSATAAGAYDFGTVNDFDDASVIVKPIYVRKEFSEVEVLCEGEAAGFDATLDSPTQVTVQGLKSGPYLYFNVTYYFENSLNFLGEDFDGQAHTFTLWDKWGGNLLALGSKPASFNPAKNGPNANRLTLEDGSSFKIDPKLNGPDSYRGYIGEGLDISDLASQGEAWITMHLGDQQGDTNPGKGKGSNKDGKSYDTDVVWYIGELGVDESATISLIIAPGKNPAGQLQFSSPGCTVINTGPVVRAHSANYENFLYAVKGNSLTVFVVR